MQATLNPPATEAPRKSGLRTWGPLALVVILAALPLLPLPDFWIIQLNYIGIYTLPVLGLVLLTGVGGLTSFGQAAFVGIGAYTTAYLSVNYGLSPWLTLFIGLALTGVSAAIIGGITLRMSGHYLPLATIAWALSLYYLMGNLEALGKYDGILGVKGLNLFGIEVGQQRVFYAVTWTFALLAAFAVIRLLDSRSGRAIRALSGGSQMAEAMGVNTLRHKVGIFVLAAMLASISGWLFAHFQRTVNPSPFGIKMGIEYLFMVVLGGAAHVWGAMAGAGVVKLLEDQLQVLLPKLIGTSGSYELIVFGIMIVLVLKYLPNGLWDFVDRRLPRASRAIDWGDAADLPARSKPAAGEVVLDVQSIRKTLRRPGGGERHQLPDPRGPDRRPDRSQRGRQVHHFQSGDRRAEPHERRGELSRRAIGGLPSRAIAERGVSRTFQHVKMVPDMTVLENVALGAHLRGHKSAIAAMLHIDRAEERQLFREAERQLQRVGMGDHLQELAGNLAMGQQRLLEIARALCADPALLLLDEPAAGLRHKEKQALADVLRTLRSEGMSILLVEHDMDLVMDICDHIVVMEFGTHLMEGTPAEVQQSPKVRAAYLGTEH